MAVEAKRGCGYRKVGGTYLVDDGRGSPCCKLPLELSICPCCGNGIKQTRGWTWIDAGKMFGAGGCRSGDPLTMATCPAVNPASMGRVGLLWVGEKFYKRPLDFQLEASKQGISRRVSNVPRDFKAGETWVLFAHPKAIERPRTIEETGAPEGDSFGFAIKRPDGELEVDKDEQRLFFATREEAVTKAAELDLEKPLFVPGVVRITRPRGFEKIVKQSTFDSMLADRASYEASTDANREPSALLALFERDAKRSIKWVPVPDDDPDHQGTVYDDEPAPAGREETA